MTTLTLFLISWYLVTGLAIKRLLEAYKVKTPIKFTLSQSVMVVAIWPLTTFLIYLLVVVVDDAVKEAFKSD